MKKIILALTMCLTLNLSARIPVRTWECDNLSVSFYADDTMLVGDLLYDIFYQGDYMILHAGGRGMLLVAKGTNGSIYITNVDDSSDKRYFKKCN